VDFSELVLRISESVDFPLLAAFLIGILAAISPCPLATNIAATAYISRNITSRWYVATSGMLYTLGRMTRMSLFLQDAGDMFMGPLLIVMGIILLGIVKLPVFRGGGRLSSIGDRVAKRGRVGAFLLGAVFALAFCPYTAVMFFGILMPLALKTTAGVTIPAVFAIGTGLPVLLFAILLSVGVTGVSNWLNKVTATEKVMRKIVALTFIGVGVYLLAF